MKRTPRAAPYYHGAYVSTHVASHPNWRKRRVWSYVQSGKQYEEFHLDIHHEDGYQEHIRFRVKR